MRFLPRPLHVLALTAFATTVGASMDETLQIWLDADGDGRPDLYRLSAGQEDALLVNVGDGSLRDATGESGLAGRRSRAALPADFDGDGDQDLLLLTRSGSVELLVADGGVFERAIVLAGLDALEIARAEWLDYDGDGWLDMSLDTRDGQPLLLRSEAGLGFTSVELGLGDLLTPRAAVTVSVEAEELDVPADATPVEATDSTRSALRASGVKTQVPPGTGSGPGSTDALVGKPLVAGALRDQSNPTNWIGASSSPTIGALYPLGIDLSIDAGGFVGMGTLNPQERLDVNGNVRGKAFVSTVGVGPPLTVASQTKVTNLNADLLDGISASSFSTFGSSIDPSEISANAVNSTHVVDGTLMNVDVNANAGIVGSKILATFGNQNVTTFGSLGIGTSSPSQELHVSNGQALFSGGTSTTPAVEANGANGPTNGYLGVQGTTDFDGVTSADWSGLEIAVAGISTGSSSTDNVGVLGHSNDVGVRGENAADPTGDYGELGAVGRGVRAEGSVYGAELTSDNTGVYASGSANGVFAVASDNAGYGVLGIANATTGATGRGVYGLASGEDGAGVYGFAANSTGANRGVVGQSASEDGIGVLGLCTDENSVAVQGDSDNSTGQLGAVFSSFGLTTYYGVRGQCSTSLGRAVHSSGNFTATGTKNFVQPHPTDPSVEIHFTALEGNEAGTYFRSTGRTMNGFAVLDVPEEFRLVTEPEGLTAHLTAVGGRADLWIESIDLDELVIGSDTDTEFHVVMNGIRAGFAERDGIQPNSSYVPERRGVPYATQYPEALRRILVQNGTLNADYTPNEATAARYGWRLRDADEADQTAEAHRRGRDEADARHAQLESQGLSDALRSVRDENED